MATGTGRRLSVLVSHLTPAATVGTVATAQEEQVTFDGKKTDKNFLTNNPSLKKSIRFRNVPDYKPGDYVSPPVGDGPGDCKSAQEFHEKLSEMMDSQGFCEARRHLDEHAWTVLDGVLPEDLVDEARRETLRCIDEEPKTSRGNPMHTSYGLLARGEVFERLFCHPLCMMLAEYMCGKGAIVSQLSGIRKKTVGQGHRNTMEIGLHSDISLVREPFPDYPMLITIVIALDDWEEGSGGTYFIPGTQHKRCDYRKDADPGTRTPPVQCKKGSIVIWDGALWHANSPRTKAPASGPDDDRVSLHLTYQRSYYKPLEDYSHVADELIARNGPTMASLLGAPNLHNYLAQGAGVWKNS